MDKKCAVILAAGEGTRMKSKKPKALAEVLFAPMIDWVIGAANESGIDDICVVKGFGAEYLDAHLAGSCETVLQSERLGTGHAVLQAGNFIESNGGDVLVLNGDAPFIDAKTIYDALALHKKEGNSVTVISAEIDDPTGYGRIIRSADGSVERIVEQRDANAEEAAVREVNSGAFWFDGKVLMRALNSLNAKRASGENTKKEFYLTDALEEIKSYGLRAGSFTAQSEDIILGANDRVQLNALNELARHHELEKHMRAGVSIPCTDGVIICPGAKIGRDTVILTGSVIKGDSVIGEDCTIGPDSLVESSTIGADTKISHLSYIGDSDLGTGINIGCGCATANYSGNKKSRTTIKDGAFIGCHTCLVAPVEVGENAYTAAGSTVTENVPDNSLAVARSRQTVKKGWVKIKQPYKHKV